MKVFVITSDHYLDALRPFAYLFNKHWGDHQQVIVVGFQAPSFRLPSNFTFFSLGMMDDYPVNKWSDGLIDTMEAFPQEEIFCLMLEDYWITRPVHEKEIHMLAAYMDQFRYVLKIDLITDRRYAGGVSEYGTCGHIPLIKSDPASAYHMSLMAGLWNRSNLARVLQPGWSPWDVEIFGTPKLSAFGDEMIVLGTNSWTDNERECPLHHTLAHRRGDPSELFLDEIQGEDLCEMKERGLIT